MVSKFISKKLNWLKKNDHESYKYLKEKKIELLRSNTLGPRIIARHNYRYYHEPPEIVKEKILLAHDAGAEEVWHEIGHSKTAHALHDSGEPLKYVEAKGKLRRKFEEDAEKYASRKTKQYLIKNDIGR